MGWGGSHKEGTQKGGRNDILAKSCCTRDHKPAHAVKWRARHEVPTVARTFLFLSCLLPLFLFFPSSPSPTTYAPYNVLPRADPTVLETMQIKRAKTREWSKEGKGGWGKEGAKEKRREEEEERERGREQERRWVMKGKGGVQRTSH